METVYLSLKSDLIEIIYSDINIRVVNINKFKGNQTKNNKDESDGLQHNLQGKR